MNNRIRRALNAFFRKNDYRTLCGNVVGSPGYIEVIAEHFYLLALKDVKKALHEERKSNEDAMKMWGEETNERNIFQAMLSENKCIENIIDQLKKDDDKSRRTCMGSTPCNLRTRRLR